MNNIKGCIRMLGIIAMLFVFGLYSHLMMGVGNAADDFADIDNTFWCIDCGMYKMCGNAKLGFSRDYECNDCSDCLYLKSQNPIDLINLAQNDILNQCLDCFITLNKLENASMILNAHL
ncbi:MAG: hypothetical protein LBN20_05150 [Endomicrobium sp.]|jgi:hypothetical protein|nr:hypothetical protein [Endomicrobium sp.]